MSRRALGHHFFVVDNTFILHFDRKVYQKFYVDMDFESLEIVQSNGSTCHYFRDKQAVYVESYMNRFAVLPDADPADFHLLDFENGWSRSGVNDYVFDEKLPHRFDAYQALSPYYQRVDQTIYFGFTREVIDADVASFEVLYGDRVKNVAKDKYHVYFREQVVEEADAATFHFLENCFTGGYYRERDHTYYAKDKTYAYYIDTIVPLFKRIKTKDLEGFRFEIRDDLGYGLDEKYAYLFGKRRALE